jgi:hypothetical protein
VTKAQQAKFYAFLLREEIRLGKAGVSLAAKAKNVKYQSPRLDKARVEVGAEQHLLGTVLAVWNLCEAGTWIGGTRT